MNSRYIRNIFLMVAFFVAASDAMAAGTTIYSMTGNRWSYVSHTGPSCSCVPGGDDNILVRHDITMSTFTLKTNAALTIFAPAKLTINGDLTFSNDSNVLLEDGASLVVTGNFVNKNQSKLISFNGAVSIGGSFDNGNGGEISLGPNATISIAQGCSNSGTIYQNGLPYTTTACSTGPLPVKLVFFRAVQQESAVLLTWATASEKGFQYFGIERANEDLNWTEIGKVDGSGDSQVRIDYSYTDKDLMNVGKTYYRLKAVDFDGYTEYFNVAFIDYRAPKAWAVTPNPAQDGHIVLTRNFTDEQAVVATVYSVNGAQLFTKQITFLSNQYVLDTDLKPGMYVLTVKTNQNTKHMRVVVE